MNGSSRLTPLSLGTSIVGALIFVSWVIGLLLAHYPPWRVVSVGAASAAIAVSNIVAARARNDSSSPWVGMAGMLAIDAVTGGLRSPFFVAVMAPFFALPLTLRWRGLLWSAVALVAGGALAMSLMPAAWVGPPVGNPAWTVLMLLTVIPVVTIATSHAAGSRTPCTRAAARSSGVTS